MTDSIAHLTHTGAHAGLTYCGAARQAGERCAHMPYLSRDARDAFVRERIACPKCRAEYFAIWDDDSEAETCLCERCGSNDDPTEYDGEVLCIDCRMEAQDGALYRG